MNLDEDFVFLEHSDIFARKRSKLFQYNQSSDESWNKIISTLLESIEVQENIPKLRALDYDNKFADAILNSKALDLEAKFRELIKCWRRRNGAFGTIPNLIGYLIVLGFEETGNKIGFIISNEGNEIHFDLSVPQRNTFYGRKKEFEILVRTASKLDFTKLNILAITGTYGIGKSSFALNFANKFQKMFDGNIIWITGENKVIMERDFKALASILFIPTTERELKLIVDDCYEYFQWTRSLFIFDNVENYSEIESFLPKNIQKIDAFKPFILITSRDFYSWSMKNIPIQILDALSLEDSLEFLSEELGTIGNSSTSDLKDLAEELGNYPQAMRHSCAYIRNIDRGNKRVCRKAEVIQEYLKSYREESDELKRKFLENDDPHSISLLASLNLIFPKLFQNIGPQEEDIEFKVLTIIAYGSPDKIPKFLLRDLNYGETVDKILEILENYSMIYFKEEYYTIHRAVQHAFRILLPSIKGHANGKNLLIALIQDINVLIKPIKYNVLKFKYIRTYLASLESIVSYIIQYGILKDQMEFVQNLWDLYNMMEYHKDGYDCSIKISAALTALGTNDTEICYLRTQYCEAVSLIYNYKAKAAVEILESIYPKCLKNSQLGETHPLTLEVGIWYAFILGRIGEQPASEKLYNEIFKTSENLEDPIHRVRAKSGLADLQKCMGKFEASLSNFDLSLKDAKPNLGRHHYETLKTSFLMAYACFKIDGLINVKEAEENMKKLKELIFESFGYDNFLTLKAYNYYAGVLMKMNRFDDALIVVKEIRPHVKNIVGVGGENPIYLELREKWAKLKKYKPMDILRLKLENLNIKTDPNGPLKYDDKQISTIDQMFSIAESYYDMKEYPIAKSEYEKVYVAQKQVFGELNPFTLKTKTRIDEIEKLMTQCHISTPGTSSSEAEVATTRSTTSTSFQCEECLKYFKSNRTLKKHKKAIHFKDPSDKPSCPMCGKQLHDNYGVKRHLKDSCTYKELGDNS